MSGSLPTEPDGRVPLSYAAPDDPTGLAAAQARWRWYDRVAKVCSALVVVTGMLVTEHGSGKVVLVGVAVSAAGLVGYGVWRIVARAARPRRLIYRVRQRSR
ncbi:MAG: hypothetical protein ACAI43_08430 [Phycisphaerae bacterium]|nr:hypothetical protein [Tepidisphaeraceae bacterium]